MVKGRGIGQGMVMLLGGQAKLRVSLWGGDLSALNCLNSILASLNLHSLCGEPCGRAASMKLSSSGFTHQMQEGEKGCVDSELWHACAGPLVSLPAVGSRVVYFPQGHSEQVTASTNKEVDAEIPNYPSLPPQLICQLHNVTMHADVETDEVYAQMTLQPLSPQEQKDAYLPAELGNLSKQPTNYFCKILTASDTSTHGGFSVPRRAAEKVFPPLDFSQQPPAQELIARDLHNNEWKFRHIFRGQPKRHLLTTGWSVFVSAKRLVAGDSVLFIWNEKNQLLLGIRRAVRPQTVMPSSVLSCDSMHIGLLAAAAHAAATNSRFTIFYNPRASPSEFVIPLAKYVKTVYHTRVSVGMRFRMLFETEESSVRRYMGTITGISDLDPVRWSNSHWRSVKVGWDESTGGEKQPRVSLWEIEPLTTFPMYPSPFPLGLKRPWPSGLPSLHGASGAKGGELGLNSPLMWLRDGGNLGIQSLNFQGIGVTPWKQPRLDTSLLDLQSDVYQAMAAAALQEIKSVDSLKQFSPSLLQFQQTQNIPDSSSSLLLNQILQRSQSQLSQPFLHTIRENQSQTQCQSHLHHHQPLNDRQKIQQQLQQLQHFSDHQRTPHTASALSQLASAPQSQNPSLQAPSSLTLPPNFSESNGNPAATSSLSPLHSIMGRLSQNEASSLLNLQRTKPLVPPDAWLPSPKRVSFESELPSGAECVLPQVDQLGPLLPMVPQHSLSLPPFPGRECPSNLSRLRGVGSESDSTSTGMALATSNFMCSAGTDYLLNTATTTSSCIDESVLLQSPDNVDQPNPPNRTFVKVYKSGSCGRSLDITRFSSYHQLRSELAHMFGLQGQLEDPLRSGWQLVFVDRENDILLLGDDPWQEFVNNVWCIKILSPQEVQQMGAQGYELLNSVPIQRLSNSSCDDFLNREDSRNLSSGITSVGSVDF